MKFLTVHKKLIGVLYDAEDYKSKPLSLVIQCRKATELNGVVPEERLEGMDRYAVITVGDGVNVLPEKGFNIPFYGLALRDFLDILQIALETYPTITTTKANEGLINTAKKKIECLEDHFYAKTIDDIKRGNTVRFLHTMTTPQGSFITMFSVGFYIDPHINYSFPCIYVKIIQFLGGNDPVTSIKSVFKFRIKNPWRFFCDLKHKDPRLKLMCDDICGSIKRIDKEECPNYYI